jgi:hypothetical protein
MSTYIIMLRYLSFTPSTLQVFVARFDGVTQTRMQMKHAKVTRVLSLEGSRMSYFKLVCRDESELKALQRIWTFFCMFTHFSVFLELSMSNPT